MQEPRIIARREQAVNPLHFEIQKHPLPDKRRRVLVPMIALVVLILLCYLLFALGPSTQHRLLRRPPRSSGNMTLQFRG